MPLARQPEGDMMCEWATPNLFLQRSINDTHKGRYRYQGTSFGTPKGAHLFNIGFIVLLYHHSSWVIVFVTAPARQHRSVIWLPLRSNSVWMPMFRRERKYDVDAILLTQWQKWLFVPLSCWLQYQPFQWRNSWHSSSFVAGTPRVCSHYWYWRARFDRLFHTSAMYQQLQRFTRIMETYPSHRRPWEA